MEKLKEIVNKLCRYSFICWQGVCVPWGDDFSTIGDIKNQTTIIYKFLAYVAALVAVIMMVIAAYLFITAEGDDQKIEQAKKMITGGIIGLIIVFIARMIMDFVIEAIIA